MKTNGMETNGMETNGMKINRQRFVKLARLLTALVVPLVLLLLFVYVRERNSWRPRTMSPSPAEPRRIQFSSNSSTVVLHDDVVYIYDVKSGKMPIYTNTFPSSYCFIENGKYLAVPLEAGGTKAGERVNILSVWNGKSIASGPKEFLPVGVLADESTIIGRIATSDEYNNLYRWNWRSDRAPRLFLRLPEFAGGHLEILSDKATLTDGKHFWDLTGKLRFKTPQDADIRNQLYNPSRFMALSDEKNNGKKVQIWNYQTGKVQASVALASSAHQRGTFKVSPDGTMLAELARTRRSNRHLNLWDIPSGRLLRQMEVPLSTSGDYIMVFSPDGGTVAVAIAGSIILWRIK